MRQEAEDHELEAQRVAVYQAVRAQVEGLPSLTLNPARPVGGPQLSQNSRSRFPRRQEDFSELEVQGIPPPPYLQQARRTPPASDGETPNMDSNEQIRHLQEEVLQKESEIKRLEFEVEVEKDKRRHLQAERHEAVDAQRRAEDEVGRLRRKVANLDHLLDGSIKRQKELESELDLCRQETSELKRQMHDERYGYESHIRAQESRERQTRRQLEDTNWELVSEMRRNRHLDRDVGPILEREAQNAPSRSRRHDRGTSGRTYISMPKDGGSRRAIWMFT